MPFDATSYIMGRNSASGGGGGGGGDITVEPLEVTDNGTYTADEGKAYSPVTVNVPKGGGGDSAPENDVIFIDYDGTITNSYTKDEFLALSAMPENPTHDGLISQGWNWSFADAQEYVSKYGMLVVGQMYITDDGKTRLYIHIADIARNDVPVYFTQTVRNGVTIDWGDGSPTETADTIGKISSKHHIYTAIGDYVITLNPVDGCVLGLGNEVNSSSVMGPISKRVYNSMLQKVEIGRGVTKIDGFAFINASQTQYITIPNNVTNIGNFAFQNCYVLSVVVIPNGVIEISNSAFLYCYSLKNVAIPKSVETVGQNLFQNCAALKTVIVPSGITNISNGAFQFCYSLSRVVLNDGVTRIGNSAFQNCSSLANIIIPDSVTAIGEGAFQYCHSLSKVVVPNGVTDLGTSAFRYCYGLTSINIPNGVTSINGQLLQSGVSLASITVPPNVTDIGNYAFASCSSLGMLKFEPTTPPTMVSTAAWQALSTECKIYVPAGSLSAYTSATNYPNPSAYTYIEY